MASIQDKNSETISVPFKRGEWYSVSSLREFIDGVFQHIIRKNSNGYNSEVLTCGDSKSVFEEFWPFILYLDHNNFDGDFQWTAKGAAADILFRPHLACHQVEGFQVTCAFPDWDAVRPHQVEPRNHGYIASLERAELKRSGAVFLGGDIGKGEPSKPSSISPEQYFGAWRSSICNAISSKSKNRRYHGEEFILIVSACRIRFDLLTLNVDEFLMEIAEFVKFQLGGSCFRSIKIIDTSRRDVVWKLV